MSERDTQNKDHTVSLEQFIAGMKFSVPADELREAAEQQISDNDDGENHSRRRLILRLLEGTKAFDQFVEIAATDDVVSENPREALMVSVRPVWPDGKTGRIEPAHIVDTQGIIIDMSAPTLDGGYFVDMPGLTADEYYMEGAYAERRQKKEEPIKYSVAEPPSPEEQGRYYG